MPQATSISGVGATVESRAWQGSNADALVQLADAMGRIQIAKKEQAAQKLKIMLENVDKLPIDDKAIRKVAKQAGVPLADDDTISAIAKASKGGGAQASASQNPQEIPTPAQLGKGGSAEPNAAAQQAQQKWEQSLEKDPKAKATAVFESYAARARALSAAKFKNEQAKAEYDTQILSVKSAALAGDGHAIGQLMAAAEIPFNITQLAWNNADDTTRKKMYEIAAGHETEAEKKNRETSIFSSLVSHTSLNAADAYGLAHSMADGQPLSAEQQNKMGQPTFKQLADEADFMNQALALGVPADKVQGVAQAARATGSLIGALPKGLQPVFQQKLELEKKQIGADYARIGIERERLGVYKAAEAQREKEFKQRHDVAMLKLQLDETKGANKEYLDSLKIAIQSSKAGVKLDDKQMQKILDGLKPYVGPDGDPKELFDQLSGQRTGTSSGDAVEDVLK